ncbi:MAG: transcription termination/antitermination factor NusG [Acidobacteria bacterium]|nr:transcription termination/antitermination factor NusG [Acidobacteriota bacterium]
MAKNWYVLRVQSNKEETVRETLDRKAKLEGVTDRLCRIIVPTERISAMKAGRRRVSERKLYPGYVFVEMDAEDDGSVPEKVWFVIRETGGVGDFIGTEGKPTAMKPHEVDKLLGEAERSEEEAPSLKVDYGKGDQVKVKQGPFENFEGTVDEVQLDKGLVRVIVTIFGRATPVELEYWQVGPI